MKIALFGVGAVAGFVAGRLARAGYKPTLIARGQRLDAYRNGGLTLIEFEEARQYDLAVTGNPSTLGVQDIVFIGTKAHSIPAAVDLILPLLGPRTILVPLINGIPFWYFHGISGDWAFNHLDAVDPGGKVWSGLGIEKVLGCVVYVMSSSPEPGVIQNHGQEAKLILGEPTGEKSARANVVSHLLQKAYFDAPISEDIRYDLWIKLWGNLGGNTISALTEGTCDVLGADKEICLMMAEMMRESVAVAAAYGVELATTNDELENGIQRRLRYFRNLGKVPTSMLQDYQTKRSLELGPIAGAVKELGAAVGVATPTIDIIYSLVRKKAEIKGLFDPLI